MSNDNLNENDKLNENGNDNNTAVKPVQETEETAKTAGTEETGAESGAKNFTLMFVALGCLLAGIVLFILSFFIKGAGVYLLVASMIFALACASFLNGQKRRAYSTACKVLRVACYVLMVACVGVVIAGTVTVNTQK